MIIVQHHVPYMQSCLFIISGTCGSNWSKRLPENRLCYHAGNISCITRFSAIQVLSNIFILSRRFLNSIVACVPLDTFMVRFYNTGVSRIVQAWRLPDSHSIYLGILQVTRILYELKCALWHNTQNQQAKNIAMTNENLLMLRILELNLKAQRCILRCYYNKPAS